MAKFRCSNPFTAYRIQTGEWRPPKSKPRAFDTAASLQEDIDALEESSRKRQEKIAAFAATVPDARPGFSWCTHLAPRFYWSEVPRSLEGDELLKAIVTATPDDPDTLERIVYTLKHFVTGETREAMIDALSGVIGVSTEDIKARILAYKSREVSPDV